ncbi:hypothetical protein Tsubulata_034391 [Turnera subulata]|uniref:Uncharacterized protein n=1 Tax=Turnera subulata TaxID=218843 RepID=A0A9Q0F1Q3_9ROSI|nr:hypothetical protein Tsubulata_034391 [Turnera subulata]
MGTGKNFEALAETNKRQGLEVEEDEDEYDKCTSDCESDCKLVFKTLEQRRGFHRYCKEMEDTQGFGISLSTPRLPLLGMVCPFYEPNDDEDIKRYSDAFGYKDPRSNERAGVVFRDKWKFCVPPCLAQSHL